MLNQLKPLIQQQSKRKRGRKAKAKPVRISRKLELDYIRALLAIVEDMHIETVKALMPLIEQPSIGDGKRIVNDSIFSDFKSAFSKTANTVRAIVSGRDEALGQSVVSKKGQKTDNQLSAMIQQSTGIDFSGLMSDSVLKEAVDEAVAANIALINSIPQQYLDRV